MSDRFLAANGPKRQHQSRCCPLSLPLGAHLEMSLGFTAHYASSQAAVAPVCLGGCVMGPAGTFGAGGSGPTSPRRDSYLAGLCCRGACSRGRMCCPPGDPLPGSVLCAAAGLRETALLRTRFPQQEAQVSPQFYRLHTSKRQIINSRTRLEPGSVGVVAWCLNRELWNIHKDDKGFCFQTLAD